MTRKSRKKGYTIIETMIAVSLFLVVTMTGMSALLNANLLQRKSQNIRSIMDNLNFIMEDMSRNLRVGYNYRCISGTFTTTNITSPQDCVTGGAIAFENDLGDPNDDTDQWVYKIETNRTDSSGNSVYDIYKSINSGSSTSWVQLNPNEITLDSASFISVTGAPSFSSGDRTQPYVIIKLIGKITYKNTVTPFTLQTAVSQRVVDI